MPLTATAATVQRQVFENDLDFIEELPSDGDLAKYRSAASFSWKRLKIILEDPDAIKLKV